MLNEKIMVKKKEMEQQSLKSSDYPYILTSKRYDRGRNMKPMGEK